MNEQKQKLFRFNIFKASILENIRIMEYVVEDEKDIFFDLKQAQANKVVNQFLTLVENKIMKGFENAG